MDGARIRVLGLVFVSVCGGEVGEWDVMELHKLWGTCPMESSAAIRYADVFINMERHS